MNNVTSIAVWILQFLLAALFVVQGGLKLRGSAAWVSRFAAWGYPDYFCFAIGAAELAGAVALLIPRTTRLGALLLIIVMAGATATHAAHREPQIITTAVLLCLLTFIAYFRRSAAGSPISPPVVGG